MTNRLFSNLYTNSYSDVINRKQFSCICQKTIKNNSYNLYLNKKKCCVNNCAYNCDKSPINIIQAKTSYKCNINYKCNVNCKCKNACNTGILYPYGYYLCDNTTCNTC